MNTYNLPEKQPKPHPNLRPKRSKLQPETAASRPKTFNLKNYTWTQASAQLRNTLHVHVQTYVCKCVCVYVCVYVYIYIYIYIHAHIYLDIDIDRHI